MTLLDKAIKRAKRTDTPIGVMFIDLDRFKHVNDSLGHEVGDQIIKQTAQRLSLAVREADSVRRISGDEFIVILDQLNQAEDAAVVAQRIIAAFAKPMHAANRDITISGSIGIALFPNDTGNAERLVENADTAMYQAKSLGRNRYAFYTEASMNRHVNAQNWKTA